MAKIKVAITGGIGSGKSTALSYLKELGYPVFSCDEIYKEVISSKEYIDKIKEFFPEAVTHGCIERKILSEIVFNDPEKRALLNGISHPLIMQKLYEQMDTSENELVFAEVPLLFEGGFENEFDHVIVILRKEENRIQSVQERDGISKEKIKQRMQSQFDYFSKEGEERLKNCNAFVIENDGSINSLQTKLNEILNAL